MKPGDSGYSWWVTHLGCLVKTKHIRGDQGNWVEHVELSCSTAATNRPQRPERQRNWPQGEPK